MKTPANSIKQAVKEGYAKIATQGTSCCSQSCGCGAPAAKAISKSIGYSDEEMNAVPDGANLGLGCGNPVALAALKEGDVVLDLGSGAGFDAFLAAQRVGKTGRVIGVDMTPEMLAKARENAQKGKYSNVEFRQGEIEKLPVEENSIDVIISNCVINLSPDKKTVFEEAFRVLKPGGRLMVSDLVLQKELPAVIKNSVEAYVGCLAGATMKEKYLGFIKTVGFEDIQVVGQTNYPIEAMALRNREAISRAPSRESFRFRGANDATAKVVKSNPLVTEKDLKGVENSVASIKVQAFKPKGRN